MKSVNVVPTVTVDITGVTPVKCNGGATQVNGAGAQMNGGGATKNGADWQMVSAGGKELTGNNFVYRLSSMPGRIARR